MLAVIDCIFTPLVKEILQSFLNPAEAAGHWTGIWFRPKWPNSRAPVPTIGQALGGANPDPSRGPAFKLPLNCTLYWKGPKLRNPASWSGHRLEGTPSACSPNIIPDEVAGIILLDARHEAIDSKMPPAWKKMESAGKGMNQVMLLASKAGALNLLGRMMGEKAAPPTVSKLPAELRTMYLSVGYQPKYFQSNLDELAAIAESDRQVSASGNLGSLPLIVVRHGIPDLFARMPADQAVKAEQVWQELQADLARLSSNSRLLVAEKSGHGIQTDQPELVVAAIRQMTETVRK